MSTTFRSLLRKAGPKWLVADEIVEADGTKTETDSRILFPTYLLFDTFWAIVRAGVKARFPGLAPLDALAYVFGGSRVVRGPDESEAAYRARLIRAIDDLRTIGIAWALLEQIRGYCTPHAVKVRIVNNHGNYYTIDRDGTRSRNRATAWNWDGNAAAWSRFWVVIYPTTDTPAKPWARSATWGTVGETWGTAGRTWGSTATPDDVFAIRRIVATWKPAGSTCVSIIVCFAPGASPDPFDPTATAPPLPDGTWRSFGKYTVGSPTRKLPARDADSIYWRGPGTAT